MTLLLCVFKLSNVFLDTQHLYFGIHDDNYCQFEIFQILIGTIECIKLNNEKGSK